MAAKRTQVYLTEEQRRMVNEVARTKGVTIAEVIRRALDAYLDAQVDPASTLAATFGVDPGARTPRRNEWGGV